jgi:hypothetical protein
MHLFREPEARALLAQFPLQINDLPPIWEGILKRVMAHGILDTLTVRYRPATSGPLSVPFLLAGSSHFRHSLTS